MNISEPYKSLYWQGKILCTVMNKKNSIYHVQKLEDHMAWTILHWICPLDWMNSYVPNPSHKSCAKSSTDRMGNILLASTIGMTVWQNGCKTCQALASLYIRYIRQEARSAATMSNVEVSALHIIRPKFPEKSHLKFLLFQAVLLFLHLSYPLCS